MSYGGKPDKWSSCSDNDFTTWWRKQGHDCVKEGDKLIPGDKGKQAGLSWAQLRVSFHHFTDLVLFCVRDFRMQVIKTKTVPTLSEGTVVATTFIGTSPNS